MYAYANLFGHYPVRVVEVNGYGSDGYADVSLLGNIRASVPIDRIMIQERDMHADLAVEMESMRAPKPEAYGCDICREMRMPCDAHAYVDVTYSRRTGRHN